MAGTIYGSGIIWSYIISRPFPLLAQRLVVYHGVSHLFFMTSVALMLTIPYRRLTGYWDNGLRWSKPEDKLRKYDNTSQFEKNSIWGWIKPSDNWMTLTLHYLNIIKIHLNINNTTTLKTTDSYFRSPKAGNINEYNADFNSLRLCFMDHWNYSSNFALLIISQVLWYCFLIMPLIDMGTNSESSSMVNPLKVIKVFQLY